MGFFLERSHAALGIEQVLCQNASLALAPKNSVT
jgi:hypothetical protein